MDIEEGGEDFAAFLHSLSICRLQKLVNTVSYHG